jgi:hypothetical protein
MVILFLSGILENRVSKDLRIVGSTVHICVRFEFLTAVTTKIPSFGLRCRAVWQMFEHIRIDSNLQNISWQSHCPKAR